MPRSSLWLISAPGEILFKSWGISMHRLELVGMVMRHVLVPMGLELCTRIALSSLTLQEVMDLGWLVHGSSTHRLIAGLAIPMLVVWERSSKANASVCNTHRLVGQDEAAWRTDSVQYTHRFGGTKPRDTYMHRLVGRDEAAWRMDSMHYTHRFGGTKPR